MARAVAIGERRLALPIGVSAVLHLLMASALLLVRSEPAPALPPVYRVNIVAAPPGPRQAGVVAPPAARPPAQPAPVPPRAETPERMPAAPVRTPATPPRQAQAPPATPTPPTTDRTRTPVDEAPRAGGGPTGGRGTDVATVRVEGIEFPFPGYLENVVRQIALRFDPANPNAPLRAEVMFLLHRDGRVTGIRFVRRSGNYAFDLEAHGSVEAAAAAGAFGPLPAGFPDDVLPIFFSFDPRVVR